MGTMPRKVKFWVYAGWSSNRLPGLLINKVVNQVTPELRPWGNGTFALHFLSLFLGKLTSICLA